MRTLVVCLICLGLCAPALGQGAVRFDIRRRPDTRVPVAIPPGATEPGQEEIGRVMASVVAYDLEFTGLFRVVTASEYPASFTGLVRDAQSIDFAAWRGVRPAVESLVHIYAYRAGGQLVAECQLLDVETGDRVVGRRYTVSADWPRPERLLAHQFSDDVVLSVTGVRGIASSQIAFSAGPPGNKEIYVADYDGAYIRKVTDFNDISILPVFSPDGTKIAFMSYKDRYPYLYVLDRASGATTPLSTRVGLNSAPAWSPDGRQVALVLSKDANPEIYLQNVDGTGLTRLTNNPAVDSSPTFHPDGTRIAFVSERLGPPQIFIMDVQGRDVRRLSFQGGRSYDPVFSPDGRRIAYVVSKPGDGMEIYVMNADGSNPARVTHSSGMNDSPSWSADSRHIIFTSTRRGRSELWTVTLETMEERPVPNINMESQGPSWGPRRD